MKIHFSNSPLAVVGGEVYALSRFEQMFDLAESEMRNDSQTHAGPAPHLLTVDSRRGAGVSASREELLAVKTAQLSARRLADSALAAMAHVGAEFRPAAFAVDAARSAAIKMAPVLQPVAPSRRSRIVERAVDPEDCSEALDLVLDRVGSILSVYASHLPGPEWTPHPPTGDGGFASNLMTWRAGDGSIMLDLLDAFGPTCDEETHRFEVEEAQRSGFLVFGHALRAVRYLPAYAMNEARVYTSAGEDSPYVGLSSSVAGTAA